MLLAKPIGNDFLIFSNFWKKCLEWIEILKAFSITINLVLSWRGASTGDGSS